MILRSSPTCLPFVSHSTPVGRMILRLSSTYLPRVFHLFPALGALGRMVLRLSPTCILVSNCLQLFWVLCAEKCYTCLPLLSHSGWSGCSGPRDFTLFSPPVFHLCTICLARWVPWDAWFYACLLLVSCLSLACLALCLNMFSHWKILPTLIYCRDWRFDWRLI